MAVSTDSYFSNSTVGQPQLGADIDIFETTSTPKYAIGFGFQRADGCKFRYSHFGAICSAANLVAHDLSESSLGQTGAVGTTGSRRTGETLAANAVGSRLVEIVVTATADQFAGGYLSIYTGSGTGYGYRIAGNSATAANSDGVAGHVYIDLYDKLIAVIDTTTGVTITGCLYANLEPAIAITSTTGFTSVVGAVVVPHSNATYGWVQTHGVATVKTGTPAGSHGCMAFLSTNTVGSVVGVNISSAGAYGISPTVGYFVNPGTAAGYSQVYLTLE